MLLSLNNILAFLAQLRLLQQRRLRVVFRLHSWQGFRAFLSPFFGVLDFLLYELHP